MMKENNYEKPNKVITFQMEQVYRMVYGWSLVLGTQNAFELLDRIKDEIELDRKRPDDFYGVGIVEELLNHISQQKPKEVQG